MTVQTLLIITAISSFIAIQFILNFKKHGYFKWDLWDTSQNRIKKIISIIGNIASIVIPIIALVSFVWSCIIFAIIPSNLPLSEVLKMSIW